MDKKELRKKLENQLLTIMTKVNDATNRANERLDAMELTGNSSVDGPFAKFQIMQTIGFSRTSEMTNRADGSDSAVTSTKELVSMIWPFESAEAQDDKSDELERHFFKYSLPRRGYEPLEPYLARVREFMRFHWGETAEISRRKEYKCLLEWMAEIDGSGDGERKVASGEMRRVLVDIGVEISGFLIEYLWMISDFIPPREIDQRFGELKAVIGNLGVEEGSVIIKCFVAVVEFCKEAVRNAKRVRTRQKEYGKDLKRAKGMAQLFWMIAVEILRLEVAFRSPDLPMLLLSLTYISMAYHLRQKVFKDKFTAIWAKIGEIMPESSVSLFEETLNSGVNEVWKELDNLNCKTG